MVEKLAKLVDPFRLGIRRLMRVDAESREHTVVRIGERERGAAGLDPGSDRDDPRDSGFARPLDERRGRLGARVEVRVRVGHAGAAASIRASSSATTCSGSSFAKSGRGSRSACPTGSRLGSQRPAQLS